MSISVFAITLWAVEGEGGEQTSETDSPCHCGFRSRIAKGTQFSSSLCNHVT